MNVYGLSQYNKEICHPAKNNILYLILTNNAGLVLHGYCTSGMLVHNAVICVLNIWPQYKHRPKVTIFMYRNGNWDDFHTKLSNSGMYILRETLMFTHLNKILFLFKHQLKT